MHSVELSQNKRIELKQFHKISASGNDFVLIDCLNFEREPSFISSDFIIKTCERRTGVGADGLIILTSSESADFQMNYYNSDGTRGEMCGNGARASFYYFYSKHQSKSKLTLLSDAGLQRGQILENGDVLLEIRAIRDEKKYDLSNLLNGSGYYIDTGVPHSVFEVDEIEELDVLGLGRQIRNDKRFTNGTNVNFFSRENMSATIRTYERGVESETLSCGTGIAATAIFCFRKYSVSQLQIHSNGGDFITKVENDSGELIVSMSSGVTYHYKGELIDERYN